MSGKLGANAGQRKKTTLDSYTTAVTGGSCSKISQKLAFEIFFPERDTEETVRRARKICVSCPVFEECRSWAMRNCAAVPEGIFFGEGGSWRRKLKGGRIRWHDWRYTDWENIHHVRGDQPNDNLMYRWVCDMCGTKSRTYYEDKARSDYFLLQHIRQNHPESLRRSA